MTKRIAYLNGRTYRGQPIGPNEVPQLEQRDHKLIAEAGAERGLAFDIVYWDEPDLAAHYDAAIIRTCWDYTGRAEEFARTIEAQERAGLVVHNSSAIIRWNARKTYLRELGAAAIETVWADKLDTHLVAKAFDALDASEIVIKPQVGAGSIGTVRLKRNAWSEADLIEGPQGAAMIQPYLRAIETEGERSLFWFGGAYSHAIRKVPNAGEWLANIPARTTFVSEVPPPEAIAVAEAARAAAPKDLLYVRIDLVLGDDCKWRVIEIEAIEPYLFLAFAPEGARAFVDAIARVLSL
jgi:glutathione synthase/RimK-type ligase-like ATP-grasp enzyme